MEIEEKIETIVHDLGQALIHFEQDNIVLLELKEKQKMDMAFIHRFNALIDPSFPVLLLVRLAKGSFATPEVRTFAATKEAHSRFKAIALCEQSLPQRIFTNFLIKFLKKKNIKMLETVEQSRNWLLKQS